MKEIKITVEDQEVSTIIAALGGCYEELHVTSLARGAAPKRKKKYDEIGLIGRSITARAVMQAAGDYPFTQKQVEIWLEEAGLARSSASSTTHRLVKAGYLAKGEIKGTWTKVKDFVPTKGALAHP